jgi:hypothetical protein
MTTFRAYSRKATKKDCKALAKVMRESDKKEVMASHGHTPYEALINSFEVSDFCISIIYKGKVVGMCGIASLDKTVGSPWLLGSEDLVSVPRITFSFLRQSSKWINRHQKKYPMLLNYVHTENKASLMWLKHLGFNFIRKVEFSKEPFYEFVRIKEYV